MKVPAGCPLHIPTAPRVARATGAVWIVFRAFAQAFVAVTAAQAQPSSDVRPAAQGVFDVVVANGRVIDPETGLDGVRSVGIRNGRIAAISRTPRSAGTFTRFLRDFVRERQKVSLQEGLRRMTLIPAQILEHSVPAMKRKGRVQVGADADLVAFDLATVSDRGTHARPNQTAVGMRYVIVNGMPVIRDGALLRDALPGRPIRRVENRAPR